MIQTKNADMTLRLKHGAWYSCALIGIHTPIITASFARSFPDFAEYLLEREFEIPKDMVN